MDDLMRAVVAWASERRDIDAVAVVGSYARGTARPDSDLDLVILTLDQPSYVADPRWVETFGSVRSVTLEDWGLIQSLRVFYTNGLEVEFGVGLPSWASTEPLDPGTRQVAHDGLLVLYERSPLLTALVDACSN